MGCCSTRIALCCEMRSCCKDTQGFRLPFAALSASQAPGLGFHSELRHPAAQSTDAALVGKGGAATCLRVQQLRRCAQRRAVAGSATARRRVRHRRRPPQPWRTLLTFQFIYLLILKVAGKSRGCSETRRWLPHGWEE